MKKLEMFLAGSVSSRDILVFIAFIILITCNPFYLNDRINVFELGLYLPGINAIDQGLVPYRDFFHLRGPLDLYVPWVLFKIFGEQASVLNAYFFFGNVLSLVAVAFIARELIRTRYMFYLMIPVIIARTFPRVVYPFWGGLRYVWGLLAVYFLIKFLKSKNPRWMAVVGLITAFTALTSIEMGVYVVAAVAGSLVAARWLNIELSKQEIVKAVGFFLLAVAAGLAPWIMYSISQQAFIPFFKDMWIVVTRMQIVLNPHYAAPYPHNFAEALAAMTNLLSVNFKQMTPTYTYLFLLGFLIWRWRKGVCGAAELALLSLGIFGFIMYNTGFRGIWTAHFEMALMPAKIIYFFMIEFALLMVWQKRAQLSKNAKRWIYILLIGLFIFSWGYALVRYNNRFWSFQFIKQVVVGQSVDHLKRKEKEEKYAFLSLKRAQGFWVPLDQQEDLMQLERFISEQTKPNDTMVMFPELGMYHFLFDRPFLGRFPIPTFSWFDNNSFAQYLESLKKAKAKYVIVQKEMPPDWTLIYLSYEPNRIKYQRMLAAIEESYKQVASTHATWIYERK